MVEVGLLFARFLHYAATLILFGVSVFPIYTYVCRAGYPPSRFERWHQTIVLAAALCALLSGLLWFVFVVAGMTGTLSGVADSNALWSVLTDTSFGNVWLVRLIVTTILLGSIAARATLGTPLPGWLVVMFSAGLLASLAAVGHTQVHDGVTRVIHASADGLHLLAAGAWLGGLVALFYLLAMSARTALPNLGSVAVDASVRFSWMGYIAVSAIIGSGLANAWLLVGSFGNLAATSYGQLLLVKLCLFGGMLGLAAVNRLWLVPILVRNTKAGRTGGALFRLRANVFAEQVLGLLIILIVSALGTRDPGVNAAQ